MKIHYLSPSVIPSQTANSVHVMKMCRAFTENGHETVLYAKCGNSVPEGKIFDYYGVKPLFDMIRLKPPPFKKLPGDLIYAAAIARETRKRSRPQLFYGRHLYSLAAAVPPDVPFMYEAHKPPGNFFEKIIERRLFQRKNFARLVVISEALRREYLRIFPRLPGDKIRVAHDGADLPSEITTPSPHVSWPGRAGKLQVGYAGHLYPGKGMEIIASLPERLPHMDFHVIGGVKDNPAHAQKVDRAKNLHFHGFIAHGNLPWYFDRLDVVLAPYQKKVFGVGGKRDIAPWMSPLKIFEYMAARKAILCSDLPVLREIMSHRVDAWMVPPDDIDAWVRALCLLENDADLRKELGDRAYRKLSIRYTWENRARAVLGE